MGNTEGRQIGVPLVQKVVVGVPCSGRLQWWQGQAHYECKVDHCFPHPTHNQIVAEYKECYQTCHLRKMQSATHGAYTGLGHHHFFTWRGLWVDWRRV